MPTVTTTSRGKIKPRKGKQTTAGAFKKRGGSFTSGKRGITGTATVVKKKAPRKAAKVR